ncbi:hybrid sensor histidine kinase/response regulator [Cellvibrio mixtus]|uniref:hybrid sensor histidine kinase/response regulator n=1 Tax=Cellvibrio mixtus TaxID=39650 RepID=UPI000A4ABB43|nr:response regulator [Cellvibrio mixtus]
MGKKSLHSGDSEEALAAKIQLLEEELASLKQSLQAKHAINTLRTSAQNPLIDSDQDAPGPLNKSEGAIFDETWVQETLRYLVKQQHPHSIQQVLRKVGSLLGLREIGIWNWDQQDAQLYLLSQWCVSDLNVTSRNYLQAPAWLHFAIKAGSAERRLLEENQSLILSATDHDQTQATEPLRQLGIFNSLIIPLSEQNQLQGLMTLHRDNPCTWHQQDTKALGSLLGWLFRFMQQHEQLRLMNDRDTRYQYAMEASNDGIWDWNLLTNKIYFSRSYLRMLGYDYEDLPGNLKTLQDYFVHPDDLDNMLLEYQTSIDNKRDSLQLQFRLLHRDGHIIWVNSKAKFFERDHLDRPTRCVGVNTDITDFINSREELLNAKAQADLASKTKSEFLARVSHEIRTPMNAIIGIGYLLHDTRLDEQQQSYLMSVNSAADSLLQIINQLLDFSKIEAGRVILEYAHFDLDQLFEKISRLFEISALHRAVDIVYDIKADVPRFLRGDASRLSQILSHLLSNTFQYSNTNQVVVRVARLAQQQKQKQVVLQFTVEDNGLGMTAEKLAHIRERLVFNKYHADTEKNSYGLGICSHLVHLMQGDFQIDSSLNKGCKVTFTAVFEHSHLGEKTLVNHPRDLNNIRVLIVDDNTIARTIIASTARSIHLQADEIDNPFSAIERIRQADNLGQPYHFILLDYRMPNINGLQLTGLIKSDNSLKQKPRVFLISAYHRDEISSADPNAILVDEFLSKPVSESRLFDAISQAIGREQLLQQISPEVLIHDESLDILENTRMLVVEDNIVNQQVIRGILKKKHIHTSIAGNGIEALKILENTTESFDIILMDLEMPEMDGLEATKRIRAGQLRNNNQPQYIPIVAVTAQAMRGDRERCLAAGMNGYLSKPVNPELLYNTLADILRKKKVTNDNLQR